jgi:hypothetical protein
MEFRQCNVIIISMCKKKLNGQLISFGIESFLLLNFYAAAGSIASNDAPIFAAAFVFNQRRNANVMA